MIDTILFDLDQTLIDWSGKSESWDDKYARYGQNLYDALCARGFAPPPPDTLRQLLQQQVIAVWQEAKVDFRGARIQDAVSRALADAGIFAPDLDIDELLRAFDWRPTQGVVCFPDTHAVLDELLRRGYRLGLVTNSFTPMWMRDIELAHYGLLPYFPVRLTSGDAGYMKPHPAIYEQALARLGATPQQAMFVGDRLANDIAGANAVGLTSVWMRPDPPYEGEPADVVPDHTITRLSELLALLPA